MLEIANLFVAILRILFFVTALIFVNSRPVKHRRVKRLVTTAISIMLALQVAAPLIYLFVPRFSSTQTVGVLFLLVSSLDSLFHLAAVALLIAAVFTERGGDDESEPEHAGNIPIVSSNPYSPPPG